MRYIIYSRVSTGKQDTENQVAKLRELYPTAIIHEETASGAKKRPVLESLLQNLVEGDCLIVAALDRLGRRTSEILTLIEDLERRGIILKSIREGVDYGTIAGKLVTQILVACAEMERGLISSRTRDALSAKRAQGIVGGRKPTYNAEVVNQVRELKAGGMSCREISVLTHMSASRVSQLCRTDLAKRKGVSEP